MRLVRQTHWTLKTLTVNQDATSVRRRVLIFVCVQSCVLTPSGHGPLRPVRPDNIWRSAVAS